MAQREWFLVCNLCGDAHEGPCYCGCTQPPPFTNEDVALLAKARFALGMGYGDCPDDLDRTESLAARIASLMPPPTVKDTLLRVYKSGL